METQYDERRERFLRTCKHFLGILKPVCDAGERFEDHRGTNEKGFACIRNYAWQQGGCPQCPKFQAQTEEEFRAQNESFAVACAKIFGEGKSPCCDAPLDSSQVIQSGRHSGHGARTCSKCNRVVMRV